MNFPVDVVRSKVFIGPRINIPFNNISGATVLEANLIQAAPIEIIQVNLTRTSSNPVQFLFEIFSNQSLTDLVFRFQTDNQVDVIIGLKLQFENTDISQASKMYLRITPASGFNHSFLARIFYKIE